MCPFYFYILSSGAFPQSADVGRMQKAAVTQKSVHIETSGIYAWRRIKQKQNRSWLVNILIYVLSNQIQGPIFQNVKML